MIYPIVKYGDPVLEKPAEPVTVFDAELRKLVEDMFESMYDAHGVGQLSGQGPRVRLFIEPRDGEALLQERLRMAGHAGGKEDQPVGIA